MPSAIAGQLLISLQCLFVLQVHKVAKSDKNKNGVIIIILFGALGILTAVFIITCIQYCRAYYKVKRPARKIMTASGHVTDDYEVLIYLLLFDNLLYSFEFDDITIYILAHF